MMWSSIMDEIISQEPTLSVQRTLDAKHYILNRWNKTHDTPMDESAVMLFLCDEQSGDLTNEQRALAKVIHHENLLICVDVFIIFSPAELTISRKCPVIRILSRGSKV